MSIPSDIRHVFEPIQPVHQFGDKVQYSEVRPDVALQPFIMCFWEFKSCHRFTDDFYANIVSDGCIDIFFEIGRPHESYVMGFSNKFTAFHFKSSFHYMGMRFAPAMFPYLFRINASELTDKVEQLSLVHRQTAEFISRHVMPARTLSEVAGPLDNYFLKTVSKLGSEIDPRLYQAIFTILQNPGAGNLERNLYNQVALSPRHLRRLFDYHIGSNVKSFSKVVRFQNFLKAHLASGNLKDKLYFDFGYYDQSHFIKEFKTFYGSTPSTALKS